MNGWELRVCLDQDQVRERFVALGRAGEFVAQGADAEAAAFWGQVGNESRFVRLPLNGGSEWDCVGFRTEQALILLDRPARTHSRGLEGLSRVYSALARSRDAVVYTDSSGALLGASERWRRLYGFAPEDVLGRNPRVINSRQHPRSFFGELWRELVNREVGTWSGELVNRCKNGDLVTVWQTITTFRDEDGSVCGYLGVTRDMTAHRELCDRLTRTNLELTAGVRRHDELLAMTVHDLKSPLNALVGWVDLAGLQLQGGAFDEIPQSLARAQDAGRRMELLIRTIGDAQRARIGQLALVPARLSVRSLVRAEVELHRAWAAGLEVAIELAEEGPVVPTFGDELRLSEAVANVLTNALRFSRRGGRVQVRHRADAAGNHEVSVEDDGPGIPLQERERVFELFYQGEAGRDTPGGKGRGSGWGLFIARKVMDLHGGHIHAEDGALGGCRMVLRFGPLWDHWSQRPWAVAILDPGEHVWARATEALGRRLPVFAAASSAELADLGEHELPNVVLHQSDVALPAPVIAGWQRGGGLLLPARLTVAPGLLAPTIDVIAQAGPPGLAAAAADLFTGRAA